jgi:hypothetical protein
VAVEVDRLFKTLYGRDADRYERASLVTFIDKQKKADADPQPKPEASPAAPDASPEAARAAAFVDLAHALANSNEFSYRF